MGGELVNDRTSNSTRRSRTRLSSPVSTLNCARVSSTLTSCTPGRSLSVPIGSAVSTTTVVRVRWRSSSNVPDSAARPARMIVTRSHSASTSARMWLDSSTVRPAFAQLADDVLEDHLHQRVETGGRLVQEVQLDVGRKRRDQRHLLPVALGVGAALLRRVELEPFQQIAAPCPVEAAAQGCPAGRSPRRR